VKWITWLRVVKSDESGRLVQALKRNSETHISRNPRNKASEYRPARNA
jgi:hypothetical protein